MVLSVNIRKHERAVWFRKGEFKAVLRPGEHTLWSALWRPADRVVTYSTLDTRFVHPLLDVLVREPALREELLVVELTDTQRALVWKAERLAYILGPGLWAFWKTPHPLRAEVFDVGAFRFEHAKLAVVLQHPDALKFFEGVQVDDHERAVLSRDGVKVGVLGPGLHVFWKGAGKIAWKSADLREQTADVAGQEIMTSDKVTLRVNLVVTFQVVDVEKAVGVSSDYAQALYREAQLALRAAVGTRPLDALLADKESVGGAVRAALAARAGEFGVAVKSVGLRDIILPGDMKAILNQVIEAQNRAQAELIKRREETAAARSQANTAKLLADNPMLARMKELELLREVLAGTKATFVFGSGGLAEQVRGLVAATSTSEGAADTGQDANK